MKSLQLALIVPAIACLFSTTKALADEPLTMKIDVENQTRVALIFAPKEGAKNGEKMPIVFVFHGHGGAPEVIAKRMKLPEAWPEALFVCMQGLPTPGLFGDAMGRQSGWQFKPGEQGDRDVKFFDALLAQIEEKYPVDKNRVYVMGGSNGGFFSYLLWAERPNVLAGVAAGSCLILPEVKITRPLPTLHFAGTDDMLILLAQQQETIDQLRALNDCAKTGVKEGAELTRYPSPTGNPVYAFIYQGGNDFPEAAGDAAIKFLKEMAAKPKG